jgi:hypothetical protein
LRDPISKKKSQKRAGRVAQGVGPEFKFQYLKKFLKIILFLNIEYVNFYFILKMIHKLKEKITVIS